MKIPEPPREVESVAVCREALVQMRNAALLRIDMDQVVILSHCIAWMSYLEELQKCQPLMKNTITSPLPSQPLAQTPSAPATPAKSTRSAAYTPGSTHETATTSSEPTGTRQSVVSPVFDERWDAKTKQQSCYNDDPENN
jgi:hypothetical protein